MANMQRKGKGVSMVNGKWRADIMKDYKRIYIGIFNTKSEAVDAYNKRASELFGEYARVS